MFHRQTILRRIAILSVAAMWCRVSAWHASAQTIADAANAPVTHPTADKPSPQAQPTGAVETADDAEAAYTRVITERADKIVAPLGITDAAKAARVRDLIVNQYRGLREIHDAIAVKTAEASKSAGADPTVITAWVAVARVQGSVKLVQLHRHFVPRLATELSPEQVDKVKDGMTYGIVDVTYKRYLAMLPELSDEQKREILANLLEAREYAMDGGSSEEKHQIFGQYKGRINNYLSKAGYNLKQAERELAAREKAGATANQQ
jgi:Protein of unknown function (DUF3826)